MEGLGAELLKVDDINCFYTNIMELSKSITVLPWIGEVEHLIVLVAILSALGGTFLLASVGIKLPGIEYDIQKEEAAYRKLVLGEDFKESAQPAKITDLYGGVRRIHYKMYFHYLILMQSNGVIIRYKILFSFSTYNCYRCYYFRFCTTNNKSFGRVETSLQYLVEVGQLLLN